MRVNHPDAGRNDHLAGDEGPTGPTLATDPRDTIETLDEEVDRLTAERDMLAEVLRDFLDLVDTSTSQRPYIQLCSPLARKCADDTRAALAKLEDEA